MQFEEICIIIVWYIIKLQSDVFGLYKIMFQSSMVEKSNHHVLCLSALYLCVYFNRF